MNIKSFKDLLETYGAELSRWPDELQDIALSFLQLSSAARDLFIEESKFDSLFTDNCKHSALFEKIMQSADIEDTDEEIPPAEQEKL